MGMNLFGRSCSGGYIPTGPAPNPDPKRWKLLKTFRYRHGYVLIVKYLDCTNFEGVKVMVFRGSPSGRRPQSLDPHFSESILSPIARFRPDEQGVEMARKLASGLTEQ